MILYSKICVFRDAEHHVPALILHAHPHSLSYLINYLLRDFFTYKWKFNIFFNSKVILHNFSQRSKKTRLVMEKTQWEGRVDNTVLIRGLDDFLVHNATDRCRDVLDARSMSPVHVVREGEEGV